MLDKNLYERVRVRLDELGFGDDYTWSQGLRAPETPHDMAGEYAWVVINSGMKNTVARGIMDRVRPLLVAGQPIATAFGHRGKVAAIESFWRLRLIHYQAFFIANATGPSSVLTWCESLPWIGKITKYHLAKNLGVDVAKPDRWLERLADAEGTSVAALCERLAYETGDRVATVDVVLWRACAIRLLTIVDDDFARAVFYNDTK